MDAPPTPALRLTPEDGRRTPNDPGHPSARVFAHGSLDLRWYAPRPGEAHRPHDRDEIYVVVSGIATFVRGREGWAFDDQGLPLTGEDTVAVAPGHVLFVPAGAAHRFEAFTPDFAVWAVFYGPEGGERP